MTPLTGFSPPHSLRMKLRLSRNCNSGLDPIFLGDNVLNARSKDFDGVNSEIESQYHPTTAPAFRALATTIGLLAGFVGVSARAQEVPPTNEELARRIEVLAQELEDREQGAVAGPLESHYGLGPAASKIYGVERGFSFGGYGEMLYQDFDPERENGQASGRKDQIDFLRFVLYTGYKFDSRVLFNAELEFEHAATGKGGEVSVEFAHLDFLVDPSCNVRAGLVLVPMGIVNEMHEPPTYFGANRPEVERRLLPTTWRANGAGIFGSGNGRLSGLSYRAYFIESLSSVGDEKFAADGLRAGRQSGAQALAEDFAVVARADYARSGLEFGGSAFFGETAQGATADLGNGAEEFGAFTSIYEAHAEFRRHGASLRALFAAADVDDAEQINAANGYTGNASVGSRLIGWYAEAGWDVLTVFRPGSLHALSPYARYTELDTQHEVPAGFVATPANDLSIFTFGLAYLPHPQVVAKLDYEIRRNDEATGVDQWNLALGFHF